MKKEKTFKEICNEFSESLREIKSFLSTHGILNISDEDFWALRTYVSNHFFDFLEIHSLCNKAYEQRISKNYERIAETLVKREIAKLKESEK